MALNDTHYVEIKKDPLWIEADPVKQEDCNWDPLDFNLAGDHFLQKPASDQILLGLLKAGAQKAGDVEDPLCIDADPVKREDCTWDSLDFNLGSECQPDTAGASNQVLLGEHSACYAIEVATDSLSLESEQRPKIEDSLIQEDCSDTHAKTRCQNKINQEKGMSLHEIIRRNGSNLAKSGTDQPNTNTKSDFKCFHCGRSFSSVGSLWRHYAQKHRSKEDTEKVRSKPRWKTQKKLDFNCDECERSFTSSNYLRTHKINKHKSKVASENLAAISDQPNRNQNLAFKCNMCERTCISYCSLTAHKAKKHLSQEEREKRSAIKNEQKIFKCEVCKKKYSSNKYLRFHMAIYHQVQESSKNLAANTEQANPNSDLDFKCDECERSYTSNVFLLQHKKRMHKSNKARKRVAPLKKLFKCNVCEKSFAIKSFLKRHKNIHHQLSGPMQPAILSEFIKCQICMKSFSSRIPYLCHAVIDHQSTIARKELQLCTSKLPAMTIKEKSQKSKTQALNDHTKATNRCQNCLSGILHSCHLKDNITVKKCRYCRQSFNSHESFNEHLLTHHEYLSKICTFCETPFSNKEALTHHLSGNSCPRLQCDICLESVFSEANLIEHKEGHEKERNKCNLCPKVLKNRITLKLHMKIHIKPFQCQTCFATFQSKPKLYKHLKSHKTVCSICHETFTSTAVQLIEKWRRSIMYRMHPDVNGANKAIPKPVTCAKCSAVTTKKHFGNRCDMCNESFTCPQRLRNHLQIHEKAMHFTCNICEKFLKTESQLANHLTLDHNIPSANIDYSEHKFTVPSAPRFKCDVCGLDYSKIASVKQHIETHHSNAPLIKCDLCNRTFARQSNLMAHMTLHSSKRGELECDFCKIRFRDRHQINVHMKHHIREKRFKCDQCSAMFDSQNRLNYHIKSHSRAKDFICKLCGREYKRKDALAFHMKSHKEKDDF